MSLGHVVSLAGVLWLLPVEVRSVICDGGHYCAGARECCDDGCCYPYPHQRPSPAPPSPPPPHTLDLLIPDHWYFWCAVCAASATATACAWWAWRRRRRALPCAGACCLPLRSRASDRDSAGSCYLPPHYSRCSSFQQPPPYTEVTTKPYMYPLVITCTNGDKGVGVESNYLRVRYFNNYVMRPPGSISATSTAESLSSSYISNAANDANSVVPPPYSCAGSFEEYCAGGGVGGGGAAGGGERGSPRPALPLSPPPAEPPAARAAAPTSLPLRIDDGPLRAARGASAGVVRPQASPERYTLGDVHFDMPDYGMRYEPCLIVSPQGPRLGSSPQPGSPPSPPADTPDVGWRHFYLGMLSSGGACESPPRPTSPTLDAVKERDAKRGRKSRGRKSSLYMPSGGSGYRWPRVSPAAETAGRSFAQRAFSISAPSTPCGSGLVPSLMALTQKVSGSKSSRLNRDESNPLLSECEELEADRTDGQF